jgi:hypothetical protein
MSSDTLYSPPTVPTDVASRDSLVSRYLRLRDVSRALNNKLMRLLDKDVLREGGEKLGLLRNGTFVFNTQDESSVLMEYCIFNVRRHGRNAVEQYLCESPPDPESDEMTCLRAMDRAIYSVFVVEAAEPGLGVTVVELFTDTRYLVVDIGLSQTARPGAMFLSRLLLFDQFAATAGAVIPLVQVPHDRIPQWRAEFRRTCPQGGSPDFDPANLIAAARETGATQRIRYEDPVAPRRTEPAARVTGAREQIRYEDPVGPRGTKPAAFGLSRKQRAALKQQVGKRTRDLSRRCPCGSGKMFKNCCLKKPR